MIFQWNCHKIFFVLNIHLILGYFRSIAQPQCVQCTDIWLYCWWLIVIVDEMRRSPSFSMKKTAFVVMFKLDVGTVDVQFHREQHAGWESVGINGREGKKEFWLSSNWPKIKISPFSLGNSAVTRIKCCSHWLQTQVQCFQTLGSVHSGPICNVRQEGVLSVCPPWA